MRILRWWAPVALLLLLALPAAARFDRGRATESTVARLLELHGPSHEERIRRGVEQMARLWRDEDGDASVFLSFATQHFLTDEEALAATFAHLENTFEMVDGHLTSIGRELRHYTDVETGPIRPIDRLLAAYDPGAHVNEDLFRSKIAFATLLNFPLTTLEQRESEGRRWDRPQWAAVRLVDRFRDRVPADALQAITLATTDADAYIAGYNLYMHHVLSPEGERLFPEGLRLIAHWNLRDEIKAQYADPQGLARQRLIHAALDAIVRQSIPQAVIDNPGVDWNPATGEVTAASGQPATGSSEALARREPDTRYRKLLQVFHAMRKIDPHTPDRPTHIARSFEGQREISEERAREMFLDLFRGDTAQRVARLIEGRLGRPLEPFDIWYAGFKARAAYPEPELDAITRERYPTAAAFEADIPRILGDLGFSEERRRFLADHIVVDPSRGAGHAMGAARRDDQAHLRTRVGAEGMDYKGYNIAIHELGHNVEQVFSLNTIDHTLLQGVPASAFTEALAFVFQERDLELLGLAQPTAESQHLHALETFWATAEIAAVSLVDMAVWRWMYEHPEADPAALRDATVRIAEEVWSQTFGPLMAGQDSALLGCYSHMLAYPLYLPNYPIGHIIAFQLEEHFRGADLATEFERMCQQGRITPDQWMEGAVGSAISVEPLLTAAARAVRALDE